MVLNRPLAVRMKNSATIIVGVGFQQADFSLIVREKGSTKGFLVPYVDMLLAVDSEVWTSRSYQKFKERIQNYYKTSIIFFIDLEIDRKEIGSIKVCQAHYIKKALECFGLSICRTVLTPIIKNNGTEEGSINTEFPYRQADGALMYLMCETKTDIAYAVK